MEQQPQQTNPSASKSTTLSDAELWRVRRVFELLIKIERRRSLKQLQGVRNEEVQATQHRPSRSQETGL